MDSLQALTEFRTSQAQYLRNLLPRRPEIALQAYQPVNSFPSPAWEVDSRAIRANMRIAASLDEIDAAALTPRDYATLQTMRWEIDQTTEAASYADLDFSLISPRRTPLRDVVSVLLEHPLGTVADAERYLYLLEGLAFWFEDARAALSQRAGRGRYPSREALADFTRFMSRFRDLQLAGALRVADSRLTTIDSSGHESFRNFEREALDLRIRPQMDSLVAFLTGDYATHAVVRPGLWQEAGGKEFYRHLLRRNLGLEVEPEEAHKAGIAMLTRLDSLKRVTRQRMGWSKSEAEYVRFLQQRDDLPPLTLDQVIARVQTSLVRMRDSLGSRVRTLPAAMPRVRAATPMEALLHPEGLVIPSAYADSAATLVITPGWGGKAAQLEGESHYFRWGWPGRALAAAVAYSVESVSFAVVAHPSRTTEAGWGEYAASLAGEMGYYNDPAAAYGRLMQESLNAAWLVVDTGVHYFGWGKPQALALLRLNSVATDAELDSMFTARVIQDPGSAGAGAIGLREISAMREWMKSRLRDDFKLDAWHQELLSMGPLPLPVLAAHLEWWSWDTARQRREERAKQAAKPAKR